MKYNFDEIVQRKHTDCIKYDNLKEMFGTEDYVYKLNKGLVLRYTDTYKHDSFQVGSNFMGGLTIGYQWNIDKHWSIELEWGGGFQHSVYQGFSRKSKDEPYVMYVDRNASAEWPPLYKGGLFVGYRF